MSSAICPFLLVACSASAEPFAHIGPDLLPSHSYERPPSAPFRSSDYVIRLSQMNSFYDAPGEAGYFINGTDYGFESLSIIMTETHPRGGPPLHVHETEEAHIVYAGQITYLIGDRRFTATGPYIARVPAGVPHTFANVGDSPLNLTAVFPTKHLTYRALGPNPLTR